MERARRAAAGFSLAELLVVLAVVGLVMAATVTLLLAGQQSYGFGAARVEAQQSARVGLERMVKELRDAGYDPTGVGLPAIVVAEPTRVVYQRDLNANGVIDATRERVTFLLRGSVLRRDAGAGAQPIIEGARALALTYFDRAGLETGDPARVRSIHIRLEAGLGGPGVVMQSQVSLRNGGP